MSSKISGMISRGFKAEKCKVSLRMAMARIKVLRNKREVDINKMRRDVAQLLDSNQDQTARIRVEHVIREEKTNAAYELIDLYCELIIARLPIIDSQKNCPIDLKEAITSVIFASPRCADVPELMDIRKQFVSKYGKDFTTCALELRPGSGVSHLIIEKLSAKAPDMETKIKTLSSIAEEHNINWDSKELLEQLQTPKNDILSGSSHFPSVSQVTMGYSSFAPPNKESMENILHQENINPPLKPPEPPSSSPIKTENLRQEKGKNHEYYKDAKAAARAAAESAERAHSAARAAAELVNRKNNTACVIEVEEEEEEERKVGLSGAESSSYVAVFDESGSDNEEEPSRFSANKPDAERHERDQSLIFSERAKDSTQSHFVNSSAPAYDSDCVSSDNENENGKKTQSFSVYDEGEKLPSKKKPAETLSDDFDEDKDEVDLGFNFGKLKGGLKNKHHGL